MPVPTTEHVFCTEAPPEDSYVSKWGEIIPRTGKMFSYTFWRTQMNKDVFWSVQGYDGNESGDTIISTQYLGEPEQSRRFIQEVILTYPAGPDDEPVNSSPIQLTYSTTCQDGLNRITISRSVINHFKLDNNAFQFQFRIVRIRKKPYPKNIQLPLF